MELSRAGTADELRFGDIGMYLGRALRENPALSAVRRVEASETIRATVVGAGTYATSLSGSTISYSPGVFPLKNLPALKLSHQEQQEFLDAGPDALYERCRWFLEQNDAERMVLAIPGRLDPTYPEIKRMAACICGALERALPAGAPIVTVVERDIAKALGNAMKQETAGRRDVAAIDGIRVEAGDFVDIGRPLMDGLVVPVVVKTLLFG
jgi:ethanolamine utilization protein EutA